MIPELGHFSLIIALFLAISLGVLPIFGAARNNRVLMGVARPLAYGQFVFIGLAFAVLAHAFLANDFSVALCCTTFQLPVAGTISLCGNMGRTRGIFVVMGLVAFRLDGRRGDLQSSPA